MKINYSVEHQDNEVKIIIEGCKIDISEFSSDEGKMCLTLSKVAQPLNPNAQHKSQTKD